MTRIVWWLRDDVLFLLYLIVRWQELIKRTVSDLGTSSIHGAGHGQHAIWDAFSRPGLPHQGGSSREDVPYAA